MKHRKIKLNELTTVVNTFNDYGFKYPVTYRLGFPVIQICRYCKKIFITKKICVFEDYEAGKVICCCTKCGGRHRITLKNLYEIKKSYKIIGICFLLLLVLIYLLFFI